jgi:hypothetical protein
MFENPESIIGELFYKPFHESFERKFVILSIGGCNSAEQKPAIIDGEQYSAEVMHGNRNIEADERICRVGVLHAYTADDEQYD